MIILRQRLFNKKDPEDEIVDAGKKVAILGGANVGSQAANALLVNRLLFKKLPNNLDKENKELMDKLKGKIGASGVEIVKDTDDLLSKVKKDNPNLSEKDLKFVRDFSKRQVGPFYGFAGSTEFINENGGTRADIMAHEYGHSRHYRGRDGSELGKVMHTIDNYFTTPKKVNKVTAGAGLIAGYRAGKKEEKGEKVGVGNKLTPAIVATLGNTPLIGKEIAASRRGYKELKNLGASKEYLKNSRKTYKTSIGTYLTHNLANNLIIGYGSREVGKIIGRNAERVKDKLNKKKEDKKADKK